MEGYKFNNFLVIEGTDCKRGYKYFDVYAANAEGVIGCVAWGGRYQPGASRGLDSEAMSLLADKGLLPEECKNRSAYAFELAPKYGFTIRDFRAPRAPQK